MVRLLAGLSIVTALILLTGPEVHAQTPGVAGRINLEDGTSVEFLRVVGVNEVCSSCYGNNRRYMADHLEVDFQNSKRDVPFESLRRIAVVQYQVNPDGMGLRSCLLEIETTTGVTVQYENVVYWWLVELLDPLTGEITLQAYYMQDYSADTLNIRSIEFFN